MVTLTAVPGVAVDTSDGDSVTVYLLEGMFAAVIAVLIELSTVVLVALLEMAVRAPSRAAPASRFLMK